VLIECNTINYIEFKSIFFIIKGWFDLDDKGLNDLKKSITKTIKRNTDDSMFIKDKIISYTEFPRTLTDGYGYSMFEFTVFLKQINMIDEEQAKEPTKRIMDKIYEDNFVDANFRFKNLKRAYKKPYKYEKK